MRMSGRRRRAICGLLSFLILLAGTRAVPGAVSFLRDHKPWVKKMRAWMRGASFMGESETVLQAGGSDCGAACLAMILQEHEMEWDLPDLARRLSITSTGTSLLRLRLVSTSLGIPARSWFIRSSDMSNVPMPVVAYLRGGHFVVIRRMLAPDLLEVDDPALGRLWWPVRSFRTLWPGQALVFDPDWTPAGQFSSNWCTYVTSGHPPS